MKVNGGAMPRPKKKGPTAKPQSPSIPLESVPHLYNRQILNWHEAQFNALKAIHEKLGEILAALKE